MKAWRSRGIWVAIVFLVVVAGIFSIRWFPPRVASPDDPLHLLRELASLHDPQLADVLDQSLVFVPAGKFVRGSNAGNANERPEQLVYLDAFAIDRYEVTNIQYSRFVSATGRKAPAYWLEGTYRDGQAYYPVVGISWKDASEYCAWAGKRLPTEAEWEKACRGPKGYIYPWGNPWDSQRANTDLIARLPPRPGQAGSPTAWAYAWLRLQSAPGANDMGLRPVGSYPAGASFYGVLDLVGNASEWVFDWYNWGGYSGMLTENPVNLEPPWNHCVRGSAWHDPAGEIHQVESWSRCSTCSSAHSVADPRIGFRCAQSN
jgi:formylglycine-generating enzyme required for sulfatase activity